MFRSNFDTSKFNLENPEHYLSNPLIYLQILFYQKQWDKVIQYVKTAQRTDDLYQVLRMSDLTEDMFKTFSDEQIVEILHFSDFRIRIKLLKIIRNQCDSNPHLPELMGKLANSPENNPWINNCLQQIFVCLPAKTITNTLSGIIPSAEIENSQSTMEIFLAAQDPRFHFTKLDAKGAAGPIVTFNSDFYNGNGSRKVRRVEFQKAVFAATADALKYVQTLDPESPIIPTIVNRFSSFLICDHGIKWQANTELKQIARQIVEGFNVSKVYPNIIHQIITSGLQSLSMNGMDYLYFQKSEIITQKFIVENFFIPTCLDEINQKDKHQSNVKKMARYVFGEGSDAFLAMRTSYLENKESDLGKIWKGIIDQVGPVAAEDLLDNGHSQALNDLIKILSRTSVGDENFVICSYDEAMSIIKSIVTKIIESKSKIALTDARRYSKVLVTLILRLKEKNELNDAFEAISYLTEDGLPTIWDTLIDAETRDKLIVESIRHPTQPTKFASWITERPTCVLVKMISMLSSITKVGILLPESRRSTLDELGFQQAKAFFPRTHSQGRGRPTSEVQSMSLLEAFIMRTKFWESKDVNVLRQNLYVYSEFAQKAVVEALRARDNAKLAGAALSVHSRLMRFLVANLGSAISDQQFELAVKMLSWPCVLELGAGRDGFVDALMEFVKELPILTRGRMMPRVSLALSLIQATHSEYTPRADGVAAALLKRTLDSIFAEFPAGIRSVAASPFYLNNFLMMPREPIAAFTRRRIDLMAQRRLPEVARTFDRENEFPLQPSQVMPPLDPSLYHDLERDCWTAKGREFSCVNGQALLKAFEFVAARAAEYKPEMHKESKTVFARFMKTQCENLHGACLLVEVEFPKADPSMVSSLNDYAQHRRMVEKTVRYSRGMLEPLNGIVPEGSPAKALLNEDAFETLKKVFEFEFEDPKEAAKVKDRFVYTGWDFQIRPLRHDKELQAELGLRQFFERLQDAQSSSYSRLMGTTDTYREAVEGLRKFLEVQLPPNMKWATEFPGVETPEKVKSVLNSRRGNSTSISYARDFFTSIYRRMTSVADPAAVASALSEDHYSIQRLIELFQFDFEAKDTRLLTAVAEVLSNDLVGMKKRSRSAFLDPNEPTSNKGYQEAFECLSMLGRILSEHRATVDYTQIKSLDALARLPEKVIQEGLENRHFDLSGLLAALIRSIDFGTGEHSLQWIKEHGCAVFRLLHSPLFANSTHAIRSALLELSGAERMAVLTGIESAVVNGKYSWLDDAVIQVIKASVDTDVVGFPAPESSFDFLQELAKVNANADVLRAVLACSVEYIKRQSVFGLKAPDHAERILEVMRVAHKQDPDEMTPFILMMLNRAQTFSAMMESPALSDLLQYTPEIYASWLSASTLPHEGEFHWLYERVVSEFVCSGLVSKKPHIVELTVKVIGTLKLGKELPREIAPFVAKGLSELNPADNSIAFLRFAIQFVTKAEHQQFASTVDGFMGVFKRLQEHATKVCAARAKQLLLPRGEQSGADETQGLATIYSFIIDTFEQEVVEKLNRELKEEDRLDLGVLSKVAARAAESASASRPMIVLPEFTRMEGSLKVIGDPNFEAAVTSESKEDALSALLRLFVSSRASTVGGVPSSASSLWRSLLGVMGEKHVREAAEWPAEMAGHPAVSLIAETVVEKFPRNLGEAETLELVTKLGMFFAQRPHVYAGASGGFGSAAPVRHMMMRKMMKPMAAPCPPPPCPPPPAAMMNTAPTMMMDSAPVAPQFSCFARECGAAVKMCAKVCDDEDVEECECECCAEDCLDLGADMVEECAVMSDFGAKGGEGAALESDSENEMEEEEEQMEEDKDESDSDDEDDEEGDVYAFWE